MKKHELVKLHCLQCGHAWLPRQEETRMCPKYKSVNWDKPPKRAS